MSFTAPGSTTKIGTAEMKLSTTEAGGLKPNPTILGNVTWPGSGSVTEISSAVNIAAGSVLTIEAGAVLRFTTTSAVLWVRGTLVANGRPDARIVFEGVQDTVWSWGSSRALQISGQGAVSANVSYATFRKFSLAVSLDNGQSWPTSVLRFEDCVFERNGAAVGGGYISANIDFVRCEFSSNLSPVTGSASYMRFDGCYFHSQERGAALTGTFVNCVFMNHSGVALRAEGGATIRDSLFVSNDIAIETTSYAPVTFENCILLMNRVGVVANYAASITGGWICARPSDNSSDLIQVKSASSIQVSNVWFGVAGQNEAVIRGGIKDGYWWSYSGFANLVLISDYPTCWPASLLSLYTSYASLCSAPQDRGLDLKRPPSGVILGNVTWPGSGSVTEISSAVNIAAGSVLTIEAGAVLRFTTTSAVLWVRGTLVANGRPDARIVFEGVQDTVWSWGSSRALQISGQGAVSANVSYATFRKFSLAVSLDNGQSWPTSVLRFEDCVFERNGAAVGGGYISANIDFVRCEFSSNLSPVTGSASYMRFDGCYFHSQERGAALTGTFQVVNCVFMNHSGVAMRAEGGATIRDSLFVSNNIAIETTSIVSLLNCTIVNNRIGVLGSMSYTYGITLQVSDVDLCDNADANLVLSSQYDIIISRSWLGTALDSAANKTVSSLLSGRVLLSVLRPYPIQMDLSGIFLLWPTLPKFKAACLSPCDSPRLGKADCTGMAYSANHSLCFSDKCDHAGISTAYHSYVIAPLLYFPVF